jgi:hypothetical protein
LPIIVIESFNLNAKNNQRSRDAARIELATALGGEFGLGTRAGKELEGAICEYTEPT